MEEIRTSHSEELDRIRAEIRGGAKTGADNLELRMFLQKLWVCALQQQGADLNVYLETDAEINRYTPWGRDLSGAEAPEALFKAVDRGYAILEEVQNHPERYIPAAGAPVQAEEPAEDIPWPMYQGDRDHSGFTGAHGPLKGQLHFKKPVGLGWKCAPVIDGDTVYVSSPGMRNCLFGFDRRTGKEVFRARQLFPPKGDQLYGTPSNASTPKIAGDRIFIRDIGSRGSDGVTHTVRVYHKKTGELLHTLQASHIDYRMSFAPFAADGRFAVYTQGVHDIEKTPPVSQPMNNLVCMDAETGDEYWRFNVGAIFDEPVIYGDSVIAGTQDGYVYCLKLSGRGHAAMLSMIRWMYHAEEAVNCKPAAAEGFVVFGDNAGRIHCLEAESGRVCWTYDTHPAEHRAFAQFGTALIRDGRAFVPSADGALYGFDLTDGRLLFRTVCADKALLRSRPVLEDGGIFAADTDGMLYRLDPDGRLQMKKRVSDYPVYADLCSADGRIYISDANLTLFCVDTGGKLIFSAEQIESFRDEQGFRILTDQIAGGGYYQSKPSACKGVVYYGTPAHFMTAISAETGETLWETEVSGAISAGPAYDHGRLYFGQQGGSDAFYCLDAETGEILWTQNTGWVWGSCNVSDGLVCIPCIDGFIRCLDAETGFMRWCFRSARSTCTEPLMHDGMVYLGSWDYYYYALDAATGRLCWKKHLGGGSDSGAPTYYNGRIYLPLGAGFFRCIDGKTGEDVWTYSEPGKTDGFNCACACHDGRVFLSMQCGVGLGGVHIAPKIVCLDAETGVLIWKHDGGGLPGPVVSAGERVYFGSSGSPFIYCVDEAGNGDGTTSCFWRFRMQNKVEEPTPCLYANKLYAMSSGGYLYCIE